MYRPDSRTLKALVGLAAAAMLLCLAAGSASAALVDLTPAGGNGTVSAGSVLLSDLIADATGGVTVGDKVFTGFGYSFTGDMPLSTQVNVLGLKDVDGNWGLRFQGAFLDLPGGGNSDAHISFMAEVGFLAAQRGLKITDAHLNLLGVGAGEDSFFGVDESFIGRSETLNAHYSTLGSATTAAPDTQLTDFTLIVPPTTKLNVVKDILAIAAANSTQPARGTVVDQSFSQNVPEPTTVGLLGLSGLAMVAARRRRG
jgi:hypothetical protein